MKTTFKVRLSEADAHYADHLVSGAKVLEFFGDAATELLIRHDGDEGYFRAYEDVEFLAPVRSGDFLEIEAEIIKVGNSSRQMQFSAKKIIEATPSAQNPHAATLLKDPVLCVKATGTCVVVKN
ncbi:MAG: 3-aminobutyryl-CoA ammonia lyase [Deltaproteobacteria bacterium]|nr:3-aminobutyryl-CoA ammonia lyase [Deltaproteobacteria bacterium]